MKVKKLVVHNSLVITLYKNNIIQLLTIDNYSTFKKK